MTKKTKTYKSPVPKFKMEALFQATVDLATNQVACPKNRALLCVFTDDLHPPRFALMMYNTKHSLWQYCQDSKLTEDVPKWWTEVPAVPTLYMDVMEDTPELRAERAAQTKKWLRNLDACTRS